MRIYIDNLDFKKINMESLKKYLLYKDNYIEIYSDEGIFVIKNKVNCKKISIVDGDVLNIENYIKNYNISIDKSLIYKTKHTISHIPYNNISKEIYKYEYKEDPKSILSFNIETDNMNNIENVYFMLYDTHAGYSDADLMNPFTQESIDFFLTIINSK
jgi:hypothetical protein